MNGVLSLLFKEKTKQTKKSNVRQGKKENIFLQKESFLTVQTDPKNPPHSPVCFILQEENYKDWGHYYLLFYK